MKIQVLKEHVSTFTALIKLNSEVLYNELSFNKNNLAFIKNMTNCFDL